MGICLPGQVYSYYIKILHSTSRVQYNLTYYSILYYCTILNLGQKPGLIPQVGPMRTVPEPLAAWHGQLWGPGASGPTSRDHAFCVRIHTYIYIHIHIHIYTSIYIYIHACIDGYYIHI